MDVVAISDGSVVIVNQPSVKELGTDESFCTESSSVTNEGEEGQRESDTLVPTGPLSGFRRRRAERIAFRISRRQEKKRLEEDRKKVEEEERLQAEEEQKKIKEAIPKRLIEPDFTSLRAGRISVTVVKDESNSYGIGLAAVPRKNNLVKINALVNEGLLCHSPLHEGDILKTVNNEVVIDYRSVMLQLMKMNGPVTISVENSAQQSNPSVVQAFCRKPTPDTQLGIEFEVVEHSTTQNDLCGDPNGTQEITSSRFLQVKSIEPDGLLAYSALSLGDFVLAINGTPCTEISPEDAATVFIKSESTVNILALNPKLAHEHCSPTRVQRWLRRARRTGVGAVGGTMLGLGLIMIPLPFPPPFGEILVVGGVSVLGTEFEAPKRAMRNARNALQNAVESHGNEEVEINKLQQMESVGGDDDSTNASKNEFDCDVESEEDDEKEPVILRESFLTVMSQQHLDEDYSGANETSNDEPTISDCWSDSNIDANIDNMYSGKEYDSPSSPSPTKLFFQNVGRTVVLPFLDHVVGDQKEDGIHKQLGSRPADDDEDSVNRFVRNRDF